MKRKKVGFKYSFATLSPIFLSKNRLSPVSELRYMAPLIPKPSNDKPKKTTTPTPLLQRRGWSVSSFNNNNQYPTRAT
jgi:hypothetical protein